MEEWRTNGLVTLLTDFGLADPYAGVMKGVLLREAASRPTLVDLTHDVPAHDVETAAFFLERSFGWFETGTLHVAVVDPGVGTERGVLLAEHRGHAFLAPDNGLLTPLLRAGARARALAVERVALASRSRTFHGRDVFAPAAARLVSGARPAELGGPAPAPVLLDLPGPTRAADGSVRGRVVAIDRFGNAITDVAPELLAGTPGDWVCVVGERALDVVETYAAAPPGTVVALVDSFARIELAVRDGDAARALGLARGAAVELRRKGKR